jgi:hypothetical protein
MESVADGTRVWTINQQADRAIRNDLIAEMKGIIPQLESIDIAELEKVVEQEAQRFENAFIQLFRDAPDNESDAPKVPVFPFYEPL